MSRRRSVLWGGASEFGGASVSGRYLFGSASTAGEASVSGARRGLPVARGEGGSR